MKVDLTIVWRKTTNWLYFYEYEKFRKSNNVFIRTVSLFMLVILTNIKCIILTHQKTYSNQMSSKLPEIL